MKPRVWYLNVATRTVRALLPERFPPDDTFAAGRLPANELALFLGMEAPDRDHAVRVTRALLRERPDASSVLVRAALLHDVGKSGAPFVVWQRILAHLVRGDPPAEPRLTGLAGVRQRRRHHPRYGAEMVSAAGGSEAVAGLIERHHERSDDPDLTLLRALDDAT
jgi:putative nucleotidyltransferase with HDIG domain